MDDAAIHRVSGNAYDLSLHLLEHIGSPRAYALAMTRVVRNEVCGSITACSLSLRGENEVSDAAIHRVSRETNDLSLRLLAHSGSPRAYALAMTRVVENGAEQTLKKLGFFFFWGTRGFTVAHKENSGIALTFVEGDNRINTCDHISPNADCNCPHQCHSRATFPIPNPADKEKESDIDIEQGNNPPRIID